MATTNRILLKKSSVIGKIPGSSSLEYGELALNFSDGRLYFKDSDNNVDFFESGPTSPAILPFAANEGDFGSVSNTVSNFSYELGSLTETDNFLQDLGDVTKSDIELLEERDDSLSLFLKDNDFGGVNDPTIEKSFFLTALNNNLNQLDESFDLGLVTLNGAFKPDRFVLPSFTVSTLPTGLAGEMAFVTDEANGAVPAFYDGNNWKRLSDNQLVSTV